VLRPGAWFGLYEQMRIGDTSPRYPLPWAEDERSSFLESPETYAEMLNAAGFIVERVEDRTPAMSPPPERQQLSPAAILGQGFVQRIQNNMAATRAQVLAPVVILARADQPTLAHLRAAHSSAQLTCPPLWVRPRSRLVRGLVGCATSSARTWFRQSVARRSGCRGRRWWIDGRSCGG
jgi:hypothetical protein